MTWNWQRPEWPNFTFDPAPLAAAEAQFLQQAGVVIGASRHLPEDERADLTVELIATEAVKTSEIENEILDRESVQSSIRRQFGLAADARRARPAETGIAALMHDLYLNFGKPLDDATLFAWHQLLMRGRDDLRDIGRYRSHDEPMQIVSGAIYAPKVHFEAPPSKSIAAEMKAFCKMFNATAPKGSSPLPALARAGIAHLYFECIHPFEDGNGRLGRAIAEKALAQAVGQPTLTALSFTIEKHRKDYYAALERANKELDVTEWLVWFAGIVLEAQSHTQRWIDFLVAKTRLFDRLRGKLNERQEKALLRMMREGPDGFVGGLSASKYIAITGTTPATARRDLAELVTLGALMRTGELKGTRYWLVFGV